MLSNMMMVIIIIIINYSLTEYFFLTDSRELLIWMMRENARNDYILC